MEYVQLILALALMTLMGITLILLIQHRARDGVIQKWQGAAQEWEKERQGWEKERQGWEDERQGWEKERRGWKKERLALAEPVQDPADKILWFIGDRAEVNLGGKCYTFAKIIDFDDANIAVVRFEKSSKDLGYLNLPVDHLRKPREGSPDAHPPEEDEGRSTASGKSNSPMPASDPEDTSK